MSHSADFPLHTPLFVCVITSSGTQQHNSLTPHLFILPLCCRNTIARHSWLYLKKKTTSEWAEFCLRKPVTMLTVSVPVFHPCSVCCTGNQYSSAAGHQPRLDVLLLLRWDVYVLLCPLANIRVRNATLWHVSRETMKTNLFCLSLTICQYLWLQTSL